MSTVGKKAKTVVDIATSNDDFSMLVKALKSAGLVDTLKGNGPFTVFAPNNAAFERLSKSQRDDLFKPENKERLKNILQHHVIKGRRMAKDVKDRSSLSPMQGGSLRVQSKGGNVKIGEATLKSTDMEAENGVIHVIDRVLMP
jgi:uncharacterized surface protein with fasciclin (FAS1) repeats